jgi:hypothetical protein
MVAVSRTQARGQQKERKANRMRDMLKHTLLATALAVGTWQVAADDLVNPPWQRPLHQGTEMGGHPGGPADATFSRWETLGPTGPIYSDFAAWGGHVVPTPAYPAVLPPGSQPGSPLQFTGRAFTHNYWAGAFPLDNSGRTGVAQLSGDLSFLIPNTPRDHNEYKLMQVQIVWKPEAAGAVPALHADTVGGLSIAPTDWRVANMTLPDGWIHSTYTGTGFYDLPGSGLFNPDGEQFTVSGNVFVDQVVIDTVCIPEPGQIALGVMTALFGASYAWRRYRLTK